MTLTFDTVWIVLTVPEALAEAIADWLQDCDAPGFTGHTVRGHSGSGRGLSLVEQVSGRRQGYQYQIELPANDVDAFLSQLRSAFTGSRVRYAVLPVLAHGALHN